MMAINLVRNDLGEEGWDFLMVLFVNFVIFVTTFLNILRVIFKAVTPINEKSDEYVL